jgi:tetratricopeptide (TPR) repeat protein
LLLVQEPGNADYNLALARLEAGERKFTEAERLYDTAIHGTWQSEPELNRAKTYLELVHLFQQEGKLAKARATLQLFEAEAPRDRELRTEMVTLFRDLDDPASASAALRTLLTETPSDWHLHKLQADLLLRTGDFESALREAKIVNEHEHDDASHFNLETAQAANDLTPYARGLHAKNEAARLQSILQRLQQRLTACAPESPELAQTQHWMATVTHEAVHDNPDILDQVAGFAGNTEQRYASCPDRNAKDLAIIWIGKQA